ncbi:DNA polymerase III subunit beta [Lyngbya aestuarii]|uniref:DNA polymerase III subunit beta n=1 Tax=Lyngbya aestuarii TaxID=118322 RepID=UPI00403D85C7
MKLICTQSELNTNLSLVLRAVPSRPTHPVLGNVLLEADQENQLVLLTAFDLSMGIQTSFSAQVIAGGRITIPAKLTCDIISRLPEGEITIEDKSGEAITSEEGDSFLITLTSASGCYQVRGMEAEEFPELPQLEAGVAIHLPVEALTQGLRGTLFATSSDETKQVLTGVHLTMHQDSLEFAATDGHRLSVVQTTCGAQDASADDQDEADNSPAKSSKGSTLSNAESLEFTLPARALRELERIVGLRQTNGTINLQFEQGQIVFQGGEETPTGSLPLSYRLTSRTLEGQYPAYRQLIPQKFQRQITIERRQLLSAVERIAVLADQKNNIVKFSIDSVKQQIDLSVEAQDVGSGKESMPAQVTGESLEIAFNVKYLIDGLKALSTADIQMQMNEATVPVILTPLGGLKMTYLIMPVQIRN